jgi:tetratricopeptide (TPR) repeat protein
MDKTSEKKWLVLVCVALSVITFAAFKQVRHNEFLSYDDDVYVTRNQTVQAGLTFEGIKWAFTSFDESNWHPLTWLSHMLDCQLFDLKPEYHHLTNLLLHIINTVLLFIVLNAMTSAMWRSAFVAALFAVHPLHVESVAWVAERKDVLSTLFWLLTMAAYFRYVENPKISRYALTIVFFALGLMAKPMLVTLPFVLLLLDYWPLNRLKNISLADAFSRQTFYRLVREKIPFFGLSIISGVITFVAQRSGGSVVALAKLPLHFRLANAVLSYLKYIEKTFWPKDLIIFYPFNRAELTAAWVLLPLLFLLVASIRVIKLAPNHRYLPVGWFWFLGTLVPVLGVVQVGSQALADRYTYVPLIGLFIVVTWGCADISAKLPYRKFILSGVALVIISVMTIRTAIQVRCWQNSVSLFENATRLNENSAALHDNFATALAQQGKYDEAVEHYRIAIRLLAEPDSEILYNLACTYNNLGRYTEAIDTFRQAIKVKPNFPLAYLHLGNVYHKLSRFTEAENAYKKAIEINPGFAEAYNNLANTFGMLGRHKEAQKAALQAIKIKPDFAEAYFTLGAAYLGQGHLPQAIEALKHVIYLQPNHAQAHYNLGLTYLKSGDRKSALKQYDTLKQLDPRLTDALLKEIQK